MANAITAPDVVVAIYADDTKIFSHDPLLLQKSLHRVDDWCVNNQIQLAPDKCVTLSINRGSPHEMCVLSTNGAPIRNVDCVKDLGVLLNNKLSPSDHIYEVSKKAANKANLLFRVLTSRDISVYVKAYVSLIRPILEYASSVASPVTIREVNILEGVQRSFTRRAFRRCNLPFPSYQERLNSCKLQTLELRRWLADVTLVYKIYNNLVDIPIS